MTARSAIATVIVLGFLAALGVGGVLWWRSRAQRQQNQAIEVNAQVGILQAMEDPLAGAPCLALAKGACGTPRVVSAGAAGDIQILAADSQVAKPQQTFPSMLSLSLVNGSGFLTYYQGSLRDEIFPEYWHAIGAELTTAEPTAPVNPALLYAWYDLLFDRVARGRLGVNVSDEINAAGLRPEAFFRDWNPLLDRLRLAAQAPDAEDDALVKAAAALDMPVESQAIVYLSVAKLSPKLSQVLWQRPGELSGHYAQLVTVRPELVGIATPLRLETNFPVLDFDGFLSLVSSPGSAKPDAMVCREQQLYACRLDAAGGLARCQRTSGIERLCFGLLPNMVGLTERRIDLPAVGGPEN